MKKYTLTSISAAALLLTGCGHSIGADEESAATTTTTTTTTTTAQTTAATTVTTMVTTTKKISTDIPEGVVLGSEAEVEVYSQTTVAELITDNNVKLTAPADLIDTDGLGEKKTKVTFEYEGNEYEKEIAYNVVDTTPPLILNSGWNPYTKVGEPFDIASIIGYVDNYDRAPSVTYSGDTDTSEVGRLDLAVTVTDSSGNSTDFDLTVLVLNEIPRPEDNNARVAYSDFIDYYSDYGDVSFGIDVSAWQTNVDYDAVRDAGCEFVLMRMGYYYRDEPVMDDYYRQNMENATAAGLDVGVYFYSADNTEEGAREHARWVIEQLDGRELDYPIAFDWEEWATFQEYGMNIHDLNCVFEAFADECEKNGYSAMLYSSKNFLNNFWENRGNHPVWLAHYVDDTDYEGAFALWQASAYGRIPGIEGDVDMNIRFNSEPLD
ncbi:MAG: glycoside hydrolase family 25 [Ruminococcus sp.]|nr:glycoside hydrolase family 25 [Ruminococcus sp.]